MFMFGGGVLKQQLIGQVLDIFVKVNIATIFPLRISMNVNKTVYVKCMIKIGVNMKMLNIVLIKKKMIVMMMNNVVFVEPTREYLQFL